MKGRYKNGGESYRVYYVPKHGCTSEWLENNPKQSLLVAVDLVLYLKRSSVYVTGFIHILSILGGCI